MSIYIHIYIRRVAICAHIPIRPSSCYFFVLLRHTSVAAMPPAPSLLEDGPYQLLKLPILKQHRSTWALEFRRWVGWKPVHKSHVQF